MGIKIDGIRQGLTYGSSSETLYFHLRQDGADYNAYLGEDEGGTCTCNIYSTGGSLLLSDQVVEDGGGGGWYFVGDLDISSWEHGRGYRAKITSDVSGTISVFHEFFDVCLYPIVSPVLSGTDIDTAHPQWQYERTNAVSDWVNAIKVAHAQLYHDISHLRDNDGEPMYPHRLVDRSQLFQVSMIYVENHIVQNLIRATDDERRFYRERMASALGTLSNVFIDSDDDLVIGDDEVEDIGGRFSR